MWRSLKKQAAVFFGLATLAVGAVVLGRLTVDFMRQDPLQDLRQAATQKEDERALEMRDLTLRHYDKGKLIHQATVGEFTVSRDRRIVQAKGITDGKILENGTIALKYWASGANWDDFAKKLYADGAISAVHADWQLKTNKLEYDGPSRNLLLPNPVKGKLWGGDLVAQRFRADFGQKRYTAMAVQWIGVAQAETQPGPPRKWNVKAASFVALDNTKVEYTRPEATDGEVTIIASQGSWDRKNDVFVATGNVRYYSTEANLVANKVTLYRKERRAVLEGNVTMILKPEDQQKLEVVPLQPMRPLVPEEISKGRPAAPPTGDRQRDDELRRLDNRRKFPATITAQRVEYWYQQGARRAVATGNPQARQDLPEGQWRHIWATTAEWNGETDSLRLNSAGGQKTVRLMTSLGDDLKATSATVSTKDGDERYSVIDPEGVVVTDDDEDVPRPETNAPPPLQGAI